MTDESESTSGGRFAATEKEAETRYKKYSALDPFPEIKPSLLNSADIEDYVAATGMVVPFYRNDLKPASYGVRLKGKCVYWDDHAKKEVVILSEEIMVGHEHLKHVEEFTLKRNSIAFVSLEPTFRMPHYLAFRFNLKIKNVYRGLLLGTGPLVDPGFCGKMSFPLHNLTDDEYVFRAGEEIIYLEFTKLSECRSWVPNSQRSEYESREGVYEKFDPEKLKRTDLEHYLYHANAGRPIQSSIPAVFQATKDEASNSATAARDASRSAEAALEQAHRLRRTFSYAAVIGGGISAATIVVGMAGVAYEGFQLLQDARDLSGEIRTEIASVKSRVDDHLPEIDDQLKDVQERLTIIGAQVDPSQLEKIVVELGDLRKEIDNIKERMKDINTDTKTNEN